MNSLKKFFLFCSGADIPLLETHPEDQNKYASIGATVLLTGILAAITSTYALWTVFDAGWIAFAFGLLWGIVIFNLDRYIVMSMHAASSKKKQALIAIPRLILASFIAIVISNPLELKIFEKEIENQLVISEEIKRQEQIDLISAPYVDKKNSLDSLIQQKEAYLNQLKEKSEYLNMIALQEADGTAGSMKANLGPIYKAKKVEADKAEEHYSSNHQIIQPELIELNARKDSLQQALLVQLASLELPPYNGYAARLDALRVLSRENEGIALASWFILLLFIALECSPVLVKWLSSIGPYEYALMERERVSRQEFRTNELFRRQAWENEKQFVYETGIHRTTEAIKAEKNLIEQKLKNGINKAHLEEGGWNSQILK